jgi:hypothetical protein
MSLSHQLERAAERALGAVEPGATVSGALASESQPGVRVYVCSIDGADGTRGWLAVRGDG